MSEFKRYRLNKTKDLVHQNYYTLALENEFKDFAFSEERAPHNKSKWREQVFNVSADAPVDLEVGTGNGTHFQHHALKHKSRCLVGVEMKYKPLIQTIRRTLNAGAKNAAVVRYHALALDEVIGEGEVNDIYIHFPDPWTSPRKPQNRLVQKLTLEMFHRMQRPRAKIQFKTDSEEAFLWCLEEIRACPLYKIDYFTHDLHASPEAENNFVTAFESIFLRQKMKIHFVRLYRV